MGLFGGRSRPEEVELVLGALVDALSELGRTAPKGPKARIERAVERLGRPPVPSGLQREVKAIVSQLLEQPPEEDLNEIVGELATSLAEALAAGALLDEQLHRAIEQLGHSIPARVGKGDAKRLTREAHSVVAVARPARQRAIAAKMELLELVAALGSSLGPAMQHGGAIDRGVDELSNLLSSPEAPTTYAELRESLVGTVSRLADASAGLQSELAEARSRVHELESALDEASSELTEARDAAEHDPLTGLFNKGAFDRKLIEAIRTANREKEALTLVVLDLDHFKAVNDTHGHLVGDDVLQAVARRLLGQVRAEDVVARVGGEEFTVVLTGLDDATAVDVVERIRASIEGDAFTSEHGAFQVTVSAGIAPYHRGETPRGLVRRADSALYEAKEQGRNRFVVAA